MNRIGTYIRRFRAWMACCDELEARIARLEQRAAPRACETPRKRKGTAQADALKAKAKTLLEEGRSQSDVARQLGVSRQYISKIVRKGL